MLGQGHLPGVREWAECWAGAEETHGCSFSVAPGGNTYGKQETAPHLLASVLCKKSEEEKYSGASTVLLV